MINEELKHESSMTGIMNEVHLSNFNKFHHKWYFDSILGVQMDSAVCLTLENLEIT
jgi:hypothetical protein